MAHSRNDSLLPVFASMTTLQKLRIQNFTDQDQGWRVVCGVSVPEESRPAVGTARSLTRLYSEGTNAGDFQYVSGTLKQLNNLQELQISKDSPLRSVDERSFLSRVSQFSKLVLGLHFLNSGGASVFESVGSMIGKLSKSKHLEVSFWTIPEAGLKLFAAHRICCLWLASSIFRSTSG